MWKHLLYLFFKGPLRVFNRIEVRGIGGPIGGINPIYFKPFLDFECSMDRRVVLHENELVVIVFEEAGFQDFDVRVSCIPMLLGLKVALQNEERTPLCIPPEGCLYHYTHLLACFVCRDHFRLPFIGRSAPDPLLLFPTTPLHRTLVTPHIVSPPFDVPVSSAFAPK
jgi:hypothetical protein